MFSFSWTVLKFLGRFLNLECSKIFCNASLSYESSPSKGISKVWKLFQPIGLLKLNRLTCFDCHFQWAVCSIALGVFAFYHNYNSRTKFQSQRRIVLCNIQAPTYFWHLGRSMKLITVDNKEGLQRSLTSYRTEIFILCSFSKKKTINERKRTAIGWLIFPKLSSIYLWYSLFSGVRKMAKPIQKWVSVHLSNWFVQTEKYIFFKLI